MFDILNLETVVSNIDNMEKYTLQIFKYSIPKCLKSPEVLATGYEFGLGYESKPELEKFCVVELEIDTEST